MSFKKKTVDKVTPTVANKPREENGNENKSNQNKIILPLGTISRLSCSNKTRFVF